MTRPATTAALKGDLLFWRLMGAKYQDIADFYGLSVSAVWKSIHKWSRTHGWTDTNEGFGRSRWRPHG